MFKQKWNKLFGLLAKRLFISRSEEIIFIVSILTKLEKDIIPKSNSKK